MRGSKMKKGVVSLDWEYLGALLAQSSDDEQAVFVKSFIKECKTWGTNYQVQQQITCINQKLTKDEKEIMSMLGYDED